MVIFCEWSHIAGFFRSLCRCLSYICLSDLLPAGKMCGSSPCKCDWIASVLGTIPSTSAISYVSGKSCFIFRQSQSAQSYSVACLDFSHFSSYFPLQRDWSQDVHWGREWLILVILVVLKSWQLCQLPHLLRMKNCFLSVWRIFCFW